MNQSNETDSKKDYPAQAVVIWPKGIRHAPVLYTLGATDEETGIIERLLKELLCRQTMRRVDRHE
jgi:hypothetical protein